MNLQELDSFLFRLTPSEQRHRADTSRTLSERYQRIPKVVFDGREMYLFRFESLLENRNVCVNKESRFTFIPEHIHTVIEFLYVYAGQCTQTINGRRIEMHAGDICLLDTNVPHGIEYLDEGDIVITIEMQKAYLMQGFLQRLGNNSIINSFLLNALSENASHDQYLLFKQRSDNEIHSIIRHILCEYYAPQTCSDQVLDAYMILLFCEVLRQYRDQAFSAEASDAVRIVDILTYIEKHYLTATLKSTAEQFGYHPNYLSAYIKKETGRSFKDLLILQRLCQACFLLENTDVPIYEVAAKVGYDNIGFFYKKFEQVYKVTPALYRGMRGHR